jgi:hypothetical protein
MHALRCMVTGQQSHAEAFAVRMRNESRAGEGAVCKTKVCTVNINASEM